MNLLLIEDDNDLASTLLQYLQLSGYTCDHAADGLKGLSMLQKHNYDVLILDLMLPMLDGLHVCEQLREEGNDIPILMLTARDSLKDKMQGFQAGTDDYLIKPFAFEELTLRIEALARRRSGQVRRLQVEDLIVDLTKHEATRRGERLHLTPTGWTILETLVRASPAVVSRPTLEHAIWGDTPPESNALKVHLFHLRKTVDRDGWPPLIHTLSGYGFRLGAANGSEE